MAITRRSHFGFVFTALLLFAGCEAILTQNPAEHFVDGKIPKGAFRFANQVWDMPAIEKVLARLARDAKNPHLVRVGVMDCGLDYSNPDLIDQIDFGTDGKRVTSVGYDIMGGDRFASPQILRFEYYAFGAQSLEGGKIKGPPLDPFKKIAEYDKAFLDQFIPKLQANPALKGTIWSKITKENFSLFGAHTYVNSEFDIKDYQRIKAERPEDIVSLSWKPKAGATVNEIQSDIDMSYRPIFEEFHFGADGLPVIRGAEFGFSTMMMQPSFALSRFEGADVFYALVKDEFNQFAASSGYLKDFTQLRDFMKPRLFDVSDSSATMTGNSIKKLAEANFFNRKGYLGQDPFLKFEDSLYDQALGRKLATLEKWPRARVEPSIDDLKSMANDSIQAVSDATDWALKHPEKFTASEIKNMKEYQKKIEGWKTLFEDYLARKGWDPANLGKMEAMTPETSSIYRRYLIKTKHPLLDPKSISQSHGTHVAGIIAKQNENIRIVPLRVVTTSTKSSPIKDPILLDEFKKGFSEWLHEPLVTRALEGRFGPLFGGKKGIELVNALEAIFKDKIPKDFDTNKLDFRFLGEVEEAIDIAGKEKLKLVNISLGTGFERAVVDYRNLSSVKTVEAYFQFLKFEFFKWRIGKAAGERSPKTLFMIATGNDGAWLDGRSRSALPVDLSSAFLADFEDEAKGLVAPNNRLKNFLGVGSLSQVDELSSFSNIMISKTPQVFAHGEEVLSPVRPLSDESIVDLYERKLSPRFLGSSSTFTQEERMDEYFIEKYHLKGTPEKIKERIGILQAQFMDRSLFLRSAEAGLQTDLFLHYPAYRQRMSGTSMATPTMTGLLANSIEKELRAKGISAAKLYDHPDFSPESLIKKVFAKADPVYKDATVIDLRKWTGEILWKKTDGEIELDKKIKSIEKARATVLSSEVTRKSMILPECWKLMSRK